MISVRPSTEDSLARQSSAASPCRFQNGYELAESRRSQLYDFAEISVKHFAEELQANSQQAILDSFAWRLAAFRPARLEWT